MSSTDDAHHDNTAIDFSGGEERSTRSSILLSEQSISLSTIDNTSRAANSILTTDETVVRRGDGAQVTSSNRRKQGGGNFDSSMDVLTKMAIGEHSPTSSVGTNEKKCGINLCCCCFNTRRM